MKKQQTSPASDDAAYYAFGVGSKVRVKDAPEELYTITNRGCDNYGGNHYSGRSPNGAALKRVYERHLYSQNASVEAPVPTTHSDTLKPQ
jgi:hypothetical protein